MNIEMWRQKKAIEALDKFTGNHTSLITLLMPADTQLARISKLLTQEIGTASSIKSRVTRQSVLEALKCIQVSHNEMSK
jgi:peptide chain release factor subunit 1